MIQKRIGILTIPTQDSGGIYQYTLSMIDAIKLIENKDFQFIQIRLNNFPKLLNEDILIDNTRVPLNVKIRKLVKVMFNVGIGNLSPEIGEVRDLIDKIDLLISPVISLLPFFWNKPYIVTIHDFQHKYYPEFFPLKERLIREISYKAGKFAEMVIVESEFVKRDVIKFLGVRESKIRVIQSPPPSYLTKVNIIDAEKERVKKKYNLPEKFLFYPAQFWYHKNHIRLVEAIAILRDKYNENVQLVLCGSKKDNFINVMKRIDELKLTDRIKYIGYVPNEDMPYLYKLATALVVPTLFESVSIPIWEAMYLGCPVIASNVCALPDQIEGSGLLIDPNKPVDIAEKIYYLLTKKILSKYLISNGYKKIESLSLKKYSYQINHILMKYFYHNGT